LTVPFKLGLVGLGKIARDQHLPAIARTDGIELVAVASRNASTDEGVHYPDLESMLVGEPTLDAIILCQPPQARYEAAVLALEAGKHVFLEKPPGATISEVDALVALASVKGVSLFASWHSRYAGAVADARRWIAGQTLHHISISWKEDVRHWHPGQPWIWEAGGFGVFDPGINALSILTEIVGDPIVVLDATLEIPSNRHAPIAASLKLRTAGGAPIDAVFDWRQTGPQSWDIVVKAEGGSLLLSAGGNHLAIDGIDQVTAAEEEYPAMYRHFTDLMRSGQSDVDLAPLRLAADAFLCGKHCSTEPFHD
jgi:D-galactose 1-dehydrogenase